jgi:hypothetical protein
MRRLKGLGPAFVMAALWAWPLLGCGAAQEAPTGKSASPSGQSGPPTVTAFATQKPARGKVEAPQAIARRPTPDDTCLGIPPLRHPSRACFRGAALADPQSWHP